MSRLPKRVVCFSKGKLMPIDNLLPFLFQTKHMGLIRDIRFIFFDQNMNSLIAENPAINEALKVLGARVNYVGSIAKLPHNLDTKDAPKPSILERTLYNAKLLFHLREYFTGPVLTIGGSLGRVISALIAMNRKLFGGRHLNFLLTPLSYDTLSHFSRVMEAEYGRQPYTMNVPPCDAVLSSFSREEILSFGRIIGSTDVPLIKIGYARGFSQWRDYIEETAPRHIEKSVRRPFLFWPLTVLEREEPSGVRIDTCPYIVRTLRVLKRFEGRVQIVFRWHPTTDRDRMQELIDEAGFTDYVFSSAHPHQLLRECILIFSTSGTSLFCDAHYLGKAVVLFVTDEPNYVEHDGNGTPIASVYEPDVDHFIVNDEEHLARVIEEILERPSPDIERDPSEIRRRFPVPTDSELASLLETCP